MSIRLPLSKKTFPGLSEGFLKRRLTYFDSACLTPTPGPVADAVARFYKAPPACLLRSDTLRTREMDLTVREARESLRKLLRAQFSDEIVFTPNTTMGINLLAGAFSRIPGAVLISDAEHNSNRLPWLEQERVELPWPPGQPFPLEAYRKLLGHGIKLVSLASVSNVTGASIPVAEVVRAAHDKGIPVHLDAAQQMTHRTIDIEADQPDALSFSLHKAYGPSGLGVLYMRRQLKARLNPTLAGGGTVDDHYDATTQYTAGAPRFEFGLQNYASMAAVDATTRFLSAISAADAASHFVTLNATATELLSTLPGVRFIGPSDPAASSHIRNFYIDGADMRRVAEILDNAANTSVRVGKMCAHHTYHTYQLPASIRLSFGYHNTVDEVARCCRMLPDILKHYAG